MRLAVELELVLIHEEEAPFPEGLSELLNGYGARVVDVDVLEQVSHTPVLLLHEHGLAT